MMKTFINYFFIQHLYPTLWGLMLLLTPVLASELPNDAFREALEQKNLELIQELVLRYEKINVNLQDKEGCTALMLAVEHNYINMAKILLQHKKIKVNLQNRFGSTPLMLAICKNHVSIAELLLDHSSIQVNLQNDFGSTPLMLAIFKSHVKIATLLLKHHDLDINIQNTCGQTALMFAIIENHITLVQQILERHDLDINLQNKYRQTPLMLAVYRDHVKIIKQLLKRDDVDINLKSESGSTALAYLRDRHIDLDRLQNDDLYYVDLVKHTHLPSLHKNHVLLQRGYLQALYAQQSCNQGMQLYRDILLINKIANELEEQQRTVFYQGCLIGYEAKNSCYSIAAKGIERPKKSSHYQPLVDKDLMHLLAGYLRRVNMKRVSYVSDWAHLIRCYLWANNRFAMEQHTAHMTLKEVHFWHNQHSPYIEFLDVANSTHERALFQVVHQQGGYEAVATQYFAHSLKQKNIIQEETQVLTKSVTELTPIIMVGLNTLTHQLAT